MEQSARCHYCGSYAVTPTTPPDEAGYCEYRCDDCGEYFVDKAPEDDEAVEEAA